LTANGIIKEISVLKHIRNLVLIFIVLGIGVIWYMSRPDIAQVPMDQMVGPKPVIGAAREQIIPTINVAEVDRWKAGEKPTPADGLKVERFAGGLDHPRNMYMLPNGDILVAETNSPPSQGGGIKGIVARRMMTKAGGAVPSANRITLLRDADGDGVAEFRSTLVKGLNSPFGMALVDGRLYIANTDGVVAVPYKDGDTVITEKPVNIKNLNAKAPNMHWVRNLAASPDGKKLYVSIGSNSNIGEDGLEVERGRAMVQEIDLTTRKMIPFSVGMRNPTGLAWDNQGRLWATVNERDMLGSDLVPDYLALVQFGADYGWPWHYWGGYTDYRVKPMREDKREYERRPDYALGPHVAALGLVFADKAKLGEPYARGAFIGRHGSWNRKPASGYDVVFVPFNEKGQPVAKPINVLSGFLSKDGKAKGRPTMVVLDKSGALLVSDDVGNVIWRVTKG
jgi:glucose/arabinose dehydrogenase